MKILSTWCIQQLVESNSTKCLQASLLKHQNYIEVFMPVERKVMIKHAKHSWREDGRMSCVLGSQHWGLRCAGFRKAEYVWWIWQERKKITAKPRWQQCGHKSNDLGTEWHGCNELWKGLKRDSGKEMSHHLFFLAMDEDVKTADTQKEANQIHDYENKTTLNPSVSLSKNKSKKWFSTILTSL